MKIKETARLDLDVRPRSDFSQSNLLPLASKPPRKGNIMQGQQKVPLRPLFAKKVVNVGGMAKPRNH